MKAYQTHFDVAMAFFIRNKMLGLTITLNTLSWAGLIMRDQYTKTQRIIVRVYGWLVFLYLFVAATYVQIADLIDIWGDLDLMAETSLLLFMELAVISKILTLIFKYDKIMEIINGTEDILCSENRLEGQKIIARFLGEHSSTFFIRAKYPFNELKSPGYEFALIHQCMMMVFTGYFEFNINIFFASVVAGCRCRLKLVALSLRNICINIPVNKKNLITPEEEKLITERLHCAISQHKYALDAAEDVKHCLSEVLLVQLTVSIVIICTTAYQMAVNKSTDTIQKLSMAGYLLGASFEVFLFCFQGQSLSNASEDIADAVYECPWYTLTQPLKRTLLIIMMRAQSPAILTAGGFVTLDITEYMAIMKASYSFFTVLQQVSE
ncbi:odorant receptor 22c-like isoform X2 [Bombyx mandarina]|uniref:Odorant receptor n=1 Tax=Bombyx mandarina TaxID=7092 RepID=A0A6J2KST2_BOMMA|nr:odorant receptor 22c-like isoform X2 [Bombyx mandarina]